MGLICPCGVTVDAFALRENVRIAGVHGSVCGNLMYAADVCIATLDTSTLSLRFEDTETPNRYSFLFTANAIKSVECKGEGKNCEVTVKGTGFIGKREYPFIAVFRDQVAQAANDSVQSFVIVGFFNQTGAVPVKQGSIVALGCQHL